MHVLLKLLKLGSPLEVVYVAEQVGLAWLWWVGVGVGWGGGCRQESAGQHMHAAPAARLQASLQSWLLPSPAALTRALPTKASQSGALVVCQPLKTLFPPPGSSR